MDIPHDLQTPPAHLSEKARGWYLNVLETAADLSVPDLLLLGRLLEAGDLAETARGHMESEGAVFLDRFKQPKENPWAKIYDRAVQAQGRLYSQLKLAKGDDTQMELPLPTIESSESLAPRGPGRPSRATW